MDDLNKMRLELLEKFRKDLEEIVVKKFETTMQLERNDRIARENEIEKSVNNTKVMILETI